MPENVGGLGNVPQKRVELRVRLKSDPDSSHPQGSGERVSRLALNLEPAIDAVQDGGGSISHRGRKVIETLPRRRSLRRLLYIAQETSRILWAAKVELVMSMPQDSAGKSRRQASVLCITSFLRLVGLAPFAGFRQQRQGGGRPARGRERVRTLTTTLVVSFAALSTIRGGWGAETPCECTVVWGLHVPLCCFVQQVLSCRAMLQDE